MTTKIAAIYKIQYGIQYMNSKIAYQKMTRQNRDLIHNKVVFYHPDTSKKNWGKLTSVNGFPGVFRKLRFLPGTYQYQA